MTTSGTYTAIRDFSIAECIDESFRRCKIDQSKITGEHMLSARISLDMLFITWCNEGFQQFIIDQEILPLVGNGTDFEFTMPSGSVDIISMVFRNASITDMEISAISRKDYQDISNKYAAGQPVNYFVDKTTVPPVVKLWPVQNVTGTFVVYNRLRQIQDSGAYTNTPDTTVLYKDAICAGLAARLAQKYCDPALEDRLIADYNRIYGMAKDQDRDRAQLVIKPILGRRFR